MIYILLISITLYTLKYLIRLLIRSCWFYYHREMIKYAEGKICVTRKGQICIIFFWAITHSDKYLYNIKNCWGILWTKLNLQITLRQGYIVSSKTLCFILTLIWGIFQTIYNGIVGLRKILFTTFLYSKRTWYLRKYCRCCCRRGGNDIRRAVAKNGRSYSVLWRCRWWCDTTECSKV